MNKLLFILCFVLVIFSCQDQKKAVYEGKDMSDQASIVRDKNTKTAMLNIDVNSKWTLYAGNTVDSIDFTKPVAEGEGSGIFPLDVSPAQRSYFQLITNNGKAILSEKQLPMAGGYNFRDMGGMKTKEGRYVKWGKIIRSDDLHNLTDSDLEYLSSIPLVSIVDFRSAAEMKLSPDKVPASVKNNYPLSISPGNLNSSDDIGNFSISQVDSFMISINEMLVTDPVCIGQYKELFRLLQNKGDVPLLFHCSAGKDRTGMAAALIFLALGVDEEDVLEDYLMSNTYLSGKYAKYIVEKPNLKALFEVKPEFLMSGINRIKKDHGGVENYLKNILGVDIEKMKELYLY